MASDFYRYLFTIDPSAEALFSHDPAVMAEKFAAELGAIVQAINSFDVFSARLRHLAVRHHAAGVQPRHYGSVAEALMQALSARLDSGWTPADRECVAPRLQPGGGDHDRRVGRSGCTVTSRYRDHAAADRLWSLRFVALRAASNAATASRLIGPAFLNADPAT